MQEKHPEKVHQETLETGAKTKGLITR